jgi:hypothetical protein
VDCPALDDRVACVQGYAFVIVKFHDKGTIRDYGVVNGNGPVERLKYIHNSQPTVMHSTAHRYGPRRKSNDRNVDPSLLTCAVFNLIHSFPRSDLAIDDSRRLSSAIEIMDGIYAAWSPESRWLDFVSKDD